MNNVFLPMDAEGQPNLAGAQAAAVGIEKRRYPRHRYGVSIEIRVEERYGRPYDTYDAMTFEMSEGGLSAATPNILLVGERVELYPVMGLRLTAIVRRKSGAMYGFEFVELKEEQRAKIRESCEKLPLFTSMLDV